MRTPDSIARPADGRVAGARYSYFDHDADVGVIGHGVTLEESFEAAAVATFALMTDLAAVRRSDSKRIVFEEADVELALVRWLNLLLGTARACAMVFADFRLERDGVVWRGLANGEAWHDGLARGVEVKGATLTMLKVEQTEAGWEARCVARLRPRACIRG
jgi:SHS2 domain-containing protein